MSKSPAFQVYAKDFLTDENVAIMTNHELGCYWRLILYCWLEGSIPDDVNRIARLCGEDGTSMALLWPAIRICFMSAANDPSRLVHARLEIERQKQKNYSKEKSRAGKKGAKARWDKASKGDGKAMAQPSVSYCDGNDNDIAEGMANDSFTSPSTSPDIDLKDIGNKLNNSDPLSLSERARKANRNFALGTILHFGKFQQIYPKPGDWTEAEIQWRQKNCDDVAKIIFEDVPRRQALDSYWQEIRYIPNPENYLKKEVWKNAIVPKPKTNFGAYNTGRSIAEIRADMERTKQAEAEAAELG